jgi:hypothetical protein
MEFLDITHRAGKLEIRLEKKNEGQGKLPTFFGKKRVGGRKTNISKRSHRWRE